MERRKFLVDMSKWAAYTVLAACTQPLPEKSPTPTPKEKSGFPLGYIWRLNGGPHDDPPPPRKEGEPTPPPRVEVWYAIDIGIPEILSCGVEPNFYSGLKYKFVAVRGGTIYSINRQHGIIEIKDEDGIVWYYEHLEIDPSLKEKEEIPLYRNLGIISCRTAPGGGTSGVHVHIGVKKEINGVLEKIPIDGFEIGGWVIHNGDRAYQGTLTKEGEETRTANGNICFPNKQDPQYCRNEKGQIIRNDIPTPKR